MIINGDLLEEMLRLFYCLLFPVRAFKKKKWKSGREGGSSSLGNPVRGRGGSKMLAICQGCVYFFWNNPIRADKLSAIVSRILNKKEAFISLHLCSSSLILLFDHIHFSAIFLEVKCMKTVQMFFETAWHQGKVTVYLQIGNFLQIWIFGSK